MLHICCAPDATVPMRELQAEGWEVSGFFYGSNIHPQEEYLRRLAALRTLRDCESVPVVEAPYLPRSWFDRMAGLMEEPERGLKGLDGPAGAVHAADDAVADRKSVV